MSDHMTDWVAAYHDGELAPERRAWVEAHLAACAACRRELQALRDLSALLQEAPLPAPAAPDEDFSAQMLERLPQPRHPWWHTAGRVGLRYAPLGIFAGWAFTQAVLTVSTVLALLVGLAPARVAWLPLSGGESLWAEGAEWALTSLGLGQLTAPLEWLSPFLLVELALMVLFAVLFLAWLAAIWSRQRVLAAQNA